MSKGAGQITQWVHRDLKQLELVGIVTYWSVYALSKDFKIKNFEWVKESMPVAWSCQFTNVLKFRNINGAITKTFDVKVYDLKLNANKYVQFKNDHTINELFGAPWQKMTLNQGWWGPRESLKVWQIQVDEVI